MLKRLYHALVKGHRWALVHHNADNLQSDYILACSCGVVQILSFEGFQDLPAEELEQLVVQ